MAFWSGETLLAKLPPLIDPFDPAKVDCAAYTLRVGSEIYVSPSEAEQDAKTISIRKLGLGEAFTIPAGQFAFLLTLEKVTVPIRAIAFISMKSGIKLRGLVNVSGFHVDPGYSGNLIFAVFNAGPKAVHLKQGDDCFLIWYADLDNPDSKKVKAPGTGYTSISTEVVTKISGEVMSFEGLNAKIKKLEKDYEQRIHKIENDHRTITTVGSIVLGILATIIVGVIVTPSAKSAWDWWMTPSVKPPTASGAPPNLPKQSPQK
jgi:dCTP deaminase